MRSFFRVVARIEGRQICKSSGRKIEDNLSAVFLLNRMSLVIEKRFSVSLAWVFAQDTLTQTVVPVRFRGTVDT